MFTFEELKCIIKNKEDPSSILDLLDPTSCELVEALEDLIYKNYR